MSRYEKFRFLVSDYQLFFVARLLYNHKYMVQPEGDHEIFSKPEKPELTPINLASDQLQEELYLYRDSYLTSIDCWRCGDTLPLKEEPFALKVGYYQFYFGSVPSYPCAKCDDIHFPGPVNTVLSLKVEAALENLDTRPRFINPNRIQPEQ